MALYLAATAILMVALRLPGILVEKAKSVHSSGDIAGHLILLRAVRRGGARSLDANPQFIYDGPGYPVGFHWFLSRILRTEKSVLSLGFYVPLVFDLSLVLFASMVGIALEVNNWHWLLLFAVTPLLWSNIGRSSHISERAFGSLFGNIYLVSLVATLSNGSSFAWLGVIIGVAVVFTSSKFAMQAVTLHTFAISVSILNPTPVFILVATWLVVNTLLLGYPWKTLKGVWRFSTFYRNKLMHLHPEASRRFFGELIPKPNSFSGKKVKSNWVVRTFIDSPFHICVGLSIVFATASENLWVVVAISGVFLSLLIAVPGLTFLGESYRYLEFSIVAAFLALATSSGSSTLMLLTFLPFLALTAWVMVVRARTNGSASDASSAELMLLGNFFSQMSEHTVMCTPGRLGIYLGYRNEKLRFPWIMSAIGTNDSERKFLMTIGNEYPFPVKNYPLLQSLEPFDLVVVDRVEAPDWCLYVNGLKVGRKIYSSDRFVVIKVRNKN